MNNENNFITAIRNGNLKEVELLLPQFDINYAFENGITALIEASYRGNIDIVKLLLSVSNININQTNYLGETALMTAVIFSHKDIVKLFLQDENINLNQENIFGYSAIQMAYLTNKKDIVQLFYIHQLTKQNPEIKTFITDLIDMASGQKKYSQETLDKILALYSQQTIHIDKDLESNHPESNLDLSGDTNNNADEAEL